MVQRYLRDTHAFRFGVMSILRVGDTLRFNTHKEQARQLSIRATKLEEEISIFVMKLADSMNNPNISVPGKWSKLLKNQTPTDEAAPQELKTVLKEIADIQGHRTKWFHQDQSQMDPLALSVPSLGLKGPRWKSRMIAAFMKSWLLPAAQPVHVSSDNQGLLELPEDQLHDTAMLLRQKLREHLASENCHTDSVRSLLGRCTRLVPRFKMRHASIQERQAAVEAVLREAILHQRSQSGVERHEQRPDDETPLKRMKRSFLSAVDGEGEVVRKGHYGVKEQMTASVHGSTVPKNTCPLAWWRDHKADFTDLLPLVFRYLACRRRPLMRITFCNLFTGLCGTCGVFLIDLCYVVCPAAVMEQWRSELQHVFEFTLPVKAQTELQSLQRFASEFMLQRSADSQALPPKTTNLVVLKMEDSMIQQYRRALDDTAGAKEASASIETLEKLNKDRAEKTMLQGCGAAGLNLTAAAHMLLMEPAWLVEAGLEMADVEQKQLKDIWFF
ncbi:unnamed protein product [Symbiodinium microadriaticum]|nr:unnamed protein product [Symbiodinium microadriaticum]